MHVADGREHSTDDAFTLIELLIVVIIIGILAAIAVPIYMRQSERANRANAVSDMKNVALALETYASDHNGSFAGLNGADETNPELTGEGFRNTQWVSVRVVSDNDSYCIVGVHAKVPGKEFVLRSANGRVDLLLFGSPTC